MERFFDWTSAKSVATLIAVMANHQPQQQRPGQPQQQGSRPATKVVAIKVVMPTGEVNIDPEKVFEMALISPSGVPFPTVAVRDGDTITRYLGFPLVLVDEVQRIEIPTS